MVKRLADTVGQDGVDYVAEAYAAAYENTNLTPAEMWEECICDALGDMNIFANDKVKSAALNPLMAEIQYAAESEARGDSTTEEQNISKSGVKNEPDGKASRDLYTLTNEYIREVTPDDRRRFNRSLADLTATMRDGEVRTFYIWATENVYVFRADGYMHGEMIRSYNGNDPQVLEDLNNEYDRIDQDAETSAIWIEASENWKDQQRIDSVLYEGRRRPTSNDTLSAGASESNRTGDIEREWKNPRTEEEIHEIVNKVRVMYGLEPVDYGKQGKASRELDLIDYINEKANVERDNMTKAQQLSKIRAELESMKVGKAELIAVQKIADALYGQYGGDASVTEFRYAMLEATKLALENDGFDAAYEVIFQLKYIEKHN